MPAYRCYFLDESDHIKAAENIEVEALAEAIDMALVMLRERPHHHSVELWDGARKVYSTAVP